MLQDRCGDCKHWEKLNPMVAQGWCRHKDAAIIPITRKYQDGYLSMKNDGCEQCEKKEEHDASV